LAPSEVPADFTNTIHLLKGIFVEGFANVSNGSVIRQFITADYQNFSVKVIKILLGTVVTGVASFIEKFAVELEASGQGLLGEGQGEGDFVFHTFIMAQNATEVKGVNRPERYG
jgi:hypothetical protein